MLFSLEVGSNVGCSVGHLILQWRDLNIGSAPFERAKCSRSGARRSLCCGRFTRGCLWIVRGGEFDVLTSHPSGRRRRYLSYCHSVFQPMRPPGASTVPAVFWAPFLGSSLSRIWMVGFTPLFLSKADITAWSQGQRSQFSSWCAGRLSSAPWPLVDVISQYYCFHKASDAMWKAASDG